MSSQNSLHEPESNQTTQPQKQPSSSSSETSQESKKNKLHHESADEHDVAASEEEEEGKIGATAPPPESDGAVVAEGGGSSSGRERLKRHRVEMSGRVWIPDMWGQEDLLKDWVDCAAFDAKLVSSSIMIARDSLKEQGRRGNSIIENAELVVVDLFD